MDPFDALDLLPEAVIVVDEDGIVQVANDRARVLLDGRDVVGKPLGEVLDLRDDAGVQCVLGQWRPQVGDRLPERVLHLDVGGRRRPVAVAGRWHADGLVVTLRSAGRREALDAVQGDVVATVSHEIRSPLTSVKGFTRTLLARWDRFSDAQKRAMLETVDADADRVTRLLGELLDVSRIDAGRVQLQRQPVDVGQLARQVVDKLAVSGPGEGRDLRLVVAEGLPRVLADPDKVEQVLVNLLENALAYAPESQVRIDVDHAADRGVHVAVADDGGGIPAEERRLVFRKFGRGRDNRRAGTGLGLYITRGLVEAHGGRVWLDVDRQDGATFHVQLPPG
ncbi:sensor histidine kinase [Egicoccus halophilus]|uniref:histidine kinase n=1 Tax=Egicoccus halophilus TaxID=1670830 RepID=A0A8J3EUD6_9ACTN|nr:PAS domain-containing sensor histidine kinase [Egicoccus halophilus]GGI07484.1 PAS domain-containing sensor histidine kinase [Egicoccus halophilus]